jgi:hypothetical protein
MRPVTFFPVLLLTCFLMVSCGYRYDTLTFEPAGKAASATGPAPSVYIDTNMSVSSLIGGTVKTRKPYSIESGHEDDTFTFAAAEYTAVTVTYADGTNDPGAAKLKLPRRVKARNYESFNSTSEGVVKNSSLIIPTRFRGVVTRDEPFTLRIEGRVIKNDGTSIPFTIRQRYDVLRENGTQTWADFVSSC